MDASKKKFIPLIISGALGLLATFLFYMYVQQQTEEAKNKAILGQKNIVSVVVAKKDIPQGTTIAENMVKEESVKKDIVQPRAATSLERVVGKITVAPIAEGEQILLNKLTISGREISLSTKIPPGKRAITIPVDNISSVGGMIKPDDYVDIIAKVPIPAMDNQGKQVMQMTTMALFQNVKVLAVGQEYTTMPGPSDGKKEKTLSPVITLALSPQEASIIAFVQEQEKIHLILRSPQDTQTQQAVPATWDTVLQTVIPQAFVKQPTDQPRPVIKPKKTVEIYHGLQKEVKNLE